MIATINILAINIKYKFERSFVINHAIKIAPIVVNKYGEMSFMT